MGHTSTDMDFSLLLTLLAAITGILSLADMVSLRAHRTAGAHSRPWVTQYARSLFPVIVIVLIVRSFVIEPFRIPSASMMPGLVDGDFIFVNKFAYGLRLPVIHTKVLSVGEPKRGDVVVFRLPSNPSEHYIKRLIGVPGDHVIVRDNRIFINGVRVAASPDGHFAGGYGYTGANLEKERIGDHEHLIMLDGKRLATDYDTVVPAGQYFFMGDNRNDSLDSRFAHVGFVPARNLDGRAMVIWMNWQFPGWPLWRRFGTKIT